MNLYVDWYLISRLFEPVVILLEHWVWIICCFVVLLQCYPTWAPQSVCSTSSPWPTSCYINWQMLKPQSSSVSTCPPFDLNKFSLNELKLGLGTSFQKLVLCQKFLNPALNAKDCVFEKDTFMWTYLIDFEFSKIVKQKQDT